MANALHGSSVSALCAVQRGASVNADLEGRTHESQTHHGVSPEALSRGGLEPVRTYAEYSKVYGFRQVVCGLPAALH